MSWRQKNLLGHLLTDLDPKTFEVLCYCTNFVPPGPSVFYLPPAKAVITNLADERESTMYAAANAGIIRHEKGISSRQLQIEIYCFFLCVS